MTAFAIPSTTTISSDHALGLYEAIKVELENHLAEYSSYSDAGIRFIALGGVSSSGTADSVYLIANVGAENGVAMADPHPNNQKWANDPLVLNCIPLATTTITNRINWQLGAAVSATPGVPPSMRKFPFIRGVVSATFGGIAPRYAPNSVYTFDLRGFVTGTTVYNQTPQPCNPGGSNVASGQYRIHYDCDGNEDCFTPTKVAFYLNEHNLIGDLQAKNEARAAFPAGKLAKLRRVGHFTKGSFGNLTIFNTLEKFHDVTWYFGDFFDAGTTDQDPAPFPVIP